MFLGMSLLAGKKNCPNNHRKAEFVRAEHGLFFLRKVDEIPAIVRGQPVFVKKPSP